MKNRIYYVLNMFFLLAPLLISCAKENAVSTNKELALLEEDQEVLEEDLGDFSNYSFNLMWINKDLDKDQQYLLPETNMKQLQQWLSVIGKKKSIQLWYDSHFVSSSALENTRTFLLGDNSESHSLQPIVFRDVRELQEVKQHPRVFSQSAEVYFRVDLLRVIAAYRSLIESENDYFVYADLDVEPLSEKDIFNKKTKQKLKDFGIVMARDYMFGFENSFQIISKKDLLLQAIKAVLIDASIIEVSKYQSDAVFSVRQGFNTKEGVYNNYKYMFDYFYHLKGWGSLVHEVAGSKVEVTESWLREKFLEQPIRNLNLKLLNKNALIESKMEFTWEGDLKRSPKMRIPTRKVNRPYTQHGLGGCPQKPEDRISFNKYYVRLDESLSRPESFDNVFLHLAVKNDYLDKVQQIKTQLTDEEFYRAFASISKHYNFDKLSPFFLAVQEGKMQILKIVKDKLSGRCDLWNKLIQSIGEYRFFYSLEKDPAEILQPLAEVFAQDQDFLFALSQSLMKKEGRRSFFENAVAQQKLNWIQKIADLFKNHAALSSFQVSEDMKQNSYIMTPAMKEALEKFRPSHEMNECNHSCA